MTKTLTLLLVMVSSLAAAEPATFDRTTSSYVEVEAVNDAGAWTNRLARLAQSHRFELLSEEQTVTAYLDYDLYIDADAPNDGLDKLIAYADMSVGEGLLSLGLREISWGETAFMPILDQVNTRDLTDYRGVYSAAAKNPALMSVLEAPIGPSYLQLIWVPAPQPMQQPATIGDFTVGEAEDMQSGTDSEWGARLSLPIDVIELQLYYLNHWNRIPAYEFNAFAGDGDLIASQERDVMLGASGSYAAYDIVVRADFARHSNQPATNIGTDIERSARTQAVLGCMWSSETQTSLGLDLHWDRWDDAPAAYSPGGFVDPEAGRRSMTWLALHSSGQWLEGNLSHRIAYLRGVGLADEVFNAVVQWNVTDAYQAELQYQKIRADGFSPKILIDKPGEISTRLRYNF